MGSSIRSASGWRYTLWCRWDKAAGAPQWARCGRCHETLQLHAL
jgi:hypothetical protein